jgi:hypothetical protein
LKRAAKNEENFRTTTLAERAGLVHDDVAFPPIGDAHNNQQTAMKVQGNAIEQ